MHYIKNHGTNKSKNCSKYLFYSLLLKCPSLIRLFCCRILVHLDFGAGSFTRGTKKFIGPFVVATPDFTTYPPRRRYVTFFRLTESMKDGKGLNNSCLATV